MLTVRQVFDYSTATIGLPVELLVQEESQNELEPFPNLGDKICFQVEYKSLTVLVVTETNQPRLDPSILEAIGAIASISCSSASSIANNVPIALTPSACEFRA